YAENIANGRFLWRNRIGAEAIKVRVAHIQGDQEKQVWIFDGASFDLHEFVVPTGALGELAEVIRQGLEGESFTLLQVDAFARLGAGQEVFPSQELVLDVGSRDNRKSKYLYQVDGIAALHSQKVGNALRTIDTWYPQAHDTGPIAVEP